jgi:uncharacterized protein (DUF427 family)
VRAYKDGEVIVDSREARLLFEPGRMVRYCFPAADVRAGADVSVHEGNDARVAGIVGYVSLEWCAAVEWLEENTPVLAHPHDPYGRIDVLESSRDVRIESDGVVLAHSQRPVLLFETGLPVRYYLPREDVIAPLVDNPATTQCPYKGVATYFDVQVGERTRRRLVWTYLSPFAEVAPIAGRLAFFDERVDVTVDGELQAQPETKWSPRLGHS